MHSVNGGRQASRMPLCLVGCGGMGRRHLSGYAALTRAGLWRTDLVAVFDVRREAAEAVADDAERLLGNRPRVHTELAAVLDDEDIAALDVVTDPSTHHAIAVPALESGRHILCEKPLGLTIRACQAMLDAARSSGAVLATAENYRRGGPNRMARAVVKAGLLGRPYLMVQQLVGGTDRVVITPWRHRKERGTIALDMGVHLTDLVEFYLGPIASAYGRGLIAEPVRRTADGEPVEATGEDSLLGQFRTASGVEVQLAYLPAGPGHRYVQRTIHGSAGSMAIPPDRTDGEVELRRADGVVRGRELAAELGEAFVLDGTTVALLGPDGTGGGAPFAEVDAGYLGVEIADFVSAVLDGHPPEVDGLAGTRAVAAVLAVLESAALGGPVSLDDVLTGAVRSYQDDIDEVLGLAGPGASEGTGARLA
ncbi:Gfo/Idh/MocA family oxidoreductase [Actinopolymorpha sp. B11F2]|uniref:Gfo/Idh/MocA family protein n=1 Tax=Actinopolymorpha sp. B11F2 TaxID=3160862 RepID=UPI0032E44677